MSKIKVGDVLHERVLETVRGDQLVIPDSSRLTHLQFRRFAGCPICNLHLQTFVQRADEIESQGINEVAVFHSSQSEMQKYHDGVPFALIADPNKSLYKEFGVEPSILSVLNPMAWPAAFKGVFNHKFGLPGKGESPFGLPADFLIDREGRVLALHYGKHADDQWAVDELLAIVGSVGVTQ